MKKILTQICLLSGLLIFISCQKELVDPDGTITGGTGTIPENNPGAADITGVWKFVNLKVKTAVTNEASLLGTVFKTTTVSDYTTEKNEGTLTIDASRMTGNGLTYSVNTVATASVYENGVLARTLSLPIVNTFAPFSNVAVYTRVNADSIYFQEGAAFLNGSTQNVPPSGARIKLEQNKLYLMQHANEVKVIQGANTHIEATATATLERQ